MITAPASLPDGLDTERLSDAVRRALDSPNATVLEWTCTALTWTPLAPSTAGLYRLHGAASDGRGRRDWALVLKIVKRPDNAVEIPGAPAYWRREADAFESGVLEDLAGISAPCFFGASKSVMEDKEAVWLWLEHVTEDEPNWTRPRYAVAARDLGTFNGSYLSGRQLPPVDWLGRGWLRWWVERVGARTKQVAADAETWRIPLVRRAFPVPPIERLLELGERAPRLLAALDALPPTLSHQDSWRANLLAARHADGSDRTVLLDWSFVGATPAGTDAGILTVGSHFWLHQDAAEIALFDEEVFAAYLDGLKRAGARAGRDEIRFVYSATAALWGGLTAPVWLPAWADPQRRGWLETKFRRPLDRAVEPYARTLDFVLDLGDEAWTLLGAGS